MIYKSLMDVLEYYADMFAVEIDVMPDVSDPFMYGDPVLNIAITRQDYPAIQVLLENGANPNITGDMGYSALHEAAELGSETLVTLLLKAGARIDLVNEFGDLPVDLARKSGNKKLVNLLGG